MAPFHFPLARVLDWYRTQCRLEEERLRLCADAAAHAVTEMERHRRDSLALQMEVISSPRIQAAELAAVASFRHRTKQLDLRLRQKCQETGQALERQHGIALTAQRRLRLIEKLRDRRLSEYQYEAARELDALASETYLASFARGLVE
ncbi:MAG: hypothetical protein ABSB15_08900 [Bryobacteraceae bacterium]|jgi:hypothetical protein